MSYWKCIKTLKMNETEEIAFTEGRVYYGHVSATPLGEWAMAFTDDTGCEDHLMTSKDLHEYFVIVVTTEAEKEADREAERQELWQPGDEPYEPDYWGAYYE
jgi:hypothetical protein